MTYKQSRNYENIQLHNPDKTGYYDIPPIHSIAEDFKTCEFIAFSDALQNKTPENVGVHFYIDDYRFERLWNNPRQYLEMLRKFKYVLSPDFSMFTDFPKAMNIYNHYRKHWLASYFQSEGIKIIPTICWSDEESFKWCFDGEPLNSVVSVSSIGAAQSKESINLFLKGYEAMLEKLAPKQVLYFGKCLLEDQYTSNVVFLQTSQQKRLDYLNQKTASC